MYLFDFNLIFIKDEINIILYLKDIIIINIIIFNLNTLTQYIIILLLANIIYF